MDFKSHQKDLLKYLKSSSSTLLSTIQVLEIRDHFEVRGHYAREGLLFSLLR